MAIKRGKKRFVEYNLLYSRITINTWKGMTKYITGLYGLTGTIVDITGH